MANAGYHFNHVYLNCLKPAKDQEIDRPHFHISYSYWKIKIKWAFTLLFLSGFRSRLNLGHLRSIIFWQISGVSYQPNFVPKVSESNGMFIHNVHHVLYINLLNIDVLKVTILLNINRCSYPHGDHNQFVSIYI